MATDLEELNLITLEDLARLARRSMRSLYTDRKEGRLKTIQVGGSLRVSAAEAKRYLTGGAAKK